MRATYGNVDGWSLDASRCASVSPTSPPHAVKDGEFTVPVTSGCERTSRQKAREPGCSEEWR